MTRASSELEFSGETELREFCSGERAFWSSTVEEEEGELVREQHGGGECRGKLGTLCVNLKV